MRADQAGDLLRCLLLLTGEDVVGEWWPNGGE